jgi:hypothetical protein
MPDPYPFPFWASLLVRVGLAQVTMVQASVCLLPIDTFQQILSGRTPKVPPFIPPHGLMASRYRGDDAFLRSREGGDFTHHRTTSYRMTSWPCLSPCPSSPGQIYRPVSRERVARPQTEQVPLTGKGVWRAIARILCESIRVVRVRGRVFGSIRVPAC